MTHPLCRPAGRSITQGSAGISSQRVRAGVVSREMMQELASICFFIVSDSIKRLSGRAEGIKPGLEIRVVAHGDQGGHVRGVTQWFAPGC